jgi:signal transduction histidine kinase
VRVRLVSKDLCLYGICREVLESLQDCNWDFGRLPLWQPGLDADLWIWDCDSDKGFPPESRPREVHKIIFVLDSNKIVLYRDLLPVEAARILLKPVRPNLLQAILEQMIPSVALSARDATSETTDRIRDDRDVLLQHLLEANLTMQQDEQDRFTFLARTAHDLRAPLGAILGYCGLLLDRRLGPLNPEQLSALEKMQHSAKRMTRLTNGMQQIGLGRESSFAPMMKFGDIQDCIQLAIGEITPLAESKRLKLHVDVTPPPEQLLLEREKIEQVLVSLLDNASRVTPSGGDVHVKAFPTFWNWRSTHVTEAP